MQRDAAAFFSSIGAKKNKPRAYLAKRFSALITKIGSFQSSMEFKLRVLRSFRIKYLHLFCKEVLKEAYADSLKIQALKTCNSLRL